MLEFIKNNLAEPLKVAEDYGIEILMEPHGPLSTSADGLLKIFEVCDSESLAINYDTGNVFVAGNDPVETLKAVVDKVKHLHFKDLPPDIERGHAYGAGMGLVPLGKGACGIETIVKILKDKGFDGNATLEVAGAEALVESRKYLESLGVC
jgi:inosose dehydratase